jgi:hypothetical protein
VSDMNAGHSQRRNSQWSLSDMARVAETETEFVVTAEVRTSAESGGYSDDDKQCRTPSNTQD